jgi:hypothetical protein
MTAIHHFVQFKYQYPIKALEEETFYGKIQPYLIKIFTVREDAVTQRQSHRNLKK